jgi:hypothetical protein
MRVPDLITLDEACAIARCPSKQSYYRAVRNGILPRPLTISGPSLVDRDALVEAINRRIELERSRPLRQWRRGGA